MRLRPIFLLALCTPLACSGDSSVSPSDSGGNGGSTSNTFGVVVDSVLADRNAVVGTQLPAEVKVTLNGAGVIGATVTWTPLTRSGTVSSATSTTDTTGIAKTTWTVGDSVGTQTLTASIPGASVNLVVHASAGPMTTLTKVSPDSSTVVAGAGLLLTVRTTDRFGNTISGVPVQWTSTGGQLSRSSTTTGASGQAEVGFTTPSTPGVWTVTASVAGFGTAVFRVAGI